MADKPLNVVGNANKDPFKEYTDALEKHVKRKEMMQRFNDWRGNKLPPFSIEHLPNERDRVFGMTAEDRLLRKQWLNDQLLTAREPVHVPELYPKNPIRRMLAKPWDIFFNTLKPILGKNVAESSRFLFPKYLLGLSALWFSISYINDHEQSWEHLDGWSKISSKPRVLTGDAPLEVKRFDDFYDNGFKKRKALLNLDTATSTDQ